MILGRWNENSNWHSNSHESDPVTMRMTRNHTCSIRPYHQDVHPQVEWAMPAFTLQPQDIATFWKWTQKRRKDGNEGKGRVRHQILEAVLSSYCWCRRRAACLRLLMPNSHRPTRRDSFVSSGRAVWTGHNFLDLDLLGLSLFDS